MTAKRKIKYYLLKIKRAVKRIKRKFSKENVRRFMIHIFPVLNVLAPVIDVGFVLLFKDKFEKSDGIMKVLPTVFLVFLAWRVGKSLFLHFRSRGDAQIYLSNNRVIPIDGKQGSGKTSLAGYFAYLYRKNIYSNTPLKVRGKYCNILTDDILSLRVKVPEGSLLVIDECNLFYNNTFGKAAYNQREGYTDAIFSQAIFGQCVRHFTDGNIIYCSVDTNRLPAIIRSMFSCQLQTLSQQSYQFSFIGAPLVKMIYSAMGIPCHTGLRIWTVKHYEKILDDNYTADLTNDNTLFSPTMKFACLQSLNSFEYDDRYLRAFYQLLPSERDVFYKTLSMLDAKDDMLRDTEIYKLFEERTNGFASADADAGGA